MGITDVHVHLHTYNIEKGKAFFNILKDKGVSDVNIVTSTMTSANLYQPREFENTFALWLKRDYKNCSLSVFGCPV